MTDEDLLREQLLFIRLRLFSLGNLTAGASCTEETSGRVGLLKWKSDPARTER